MTRTKTIEILDRDARVIEMASEGYTQRQIGATLGISGARVNQILKAAREEMSDDSHRDRMAMVLDMLIQKAIILATGKGKRLVSPSGKPVYELDPDRINPRNGLPEFDLTKPIYDEYATLDAMDKVTRLMDRYARLYGLDKLRSRDKDESEEFQQAMEYVHQLAEERKVLLRKLTEYERGDVITAEVIEDRDENANREKP